MQSTDRIVFYLLVGLRCHLSESSYPQWLIVLVCSEIEYFLPLMETAVGGFNLEYITPAGQMVVTD